jgi:DNA-binding MarR family transcriptional regulator
VGKAVDGEDRAESASPQALLDRLAVLLGIEAPRPAGQHPIFDNIQGTTAARLRICQCWIDANGYRNKKLAGFFSLAPDWEILLRLYAHHLRDEPITVKVASVVAGTPLPTGFRHLDKLIADKLVERRPHCGRDRRQVFVTLTEQGVALMDDIMDWTLANMRMVLDGAERAERRSATATVTPLTRRHAAGG